MTNILDRKHFIFDFSWMFQGLNVTTIKMDIILIQKVEILKMASKMAVSLASKTYMTDVLDKNTLVLTFYGCLEAKLYKRSKKNIVFIRFRRLKFEDGVQDGRQLGS